MAIRTLKGSDLTATASYEEGVVPVNNDTVIVREGVVEVTGNLTGFSGFANGIDLIVMPGATLVIGNTGTAFNCKLLSCIAAGALHMVQTGNAAKVALNNPGCSVALQSGTLTGAVARAGSLLVGQSVAVTDLWVPGGVVKVEAHTSTDRVDTATVNGGLLVCERPIATLRGSAGRAELRKAATIQDGSGGGVCELLGDRFTLSMQCLGAVTIDLLRAYAGSLDPTKMGGDLTVTNAVRHLGAQIREAWAGGKVVYTNTPTDYGYGTAFIPGGLG